MNRQERGAIWRDELAHPCSPTTVAAMQASGANMSLVAEWQDLEGQNEPGSDWMVYEDFLKAAIGIAADHDPKGEFDTPSEHISRLTHQVNLWVELEKSVGSKPHNEVGEDREEHDAWQRSLAAAAARKAEEGRKNNPENLPNAATECIFDMEGELYCRFDPATKRFLGFGYTPSGDAYPAFAHLDGLEFDFDRSDFNNPVWKGLRDYLENIHTVSGEWAFAVQWTEDGWLVKR